VNRFPGRSHRRLLSSPSTTLRVVPPPRFAGADARYRSRDTSCPSLAYHHAIQRFAPKRERSAERRIQPMPRSASSCCNEPALGRGSAHFRARPPSGALLRLSPGRTHPPLAQLQFPRFLRPDLAGVTRFDLSRVYRAPRRPVVVPVERWPKAARERSASIRARAPPLLRPSKVPSLKAPSLSRVSVCNIISDDCQQYLKRRPIWLRE
jgi:hypothetical protein